MNRKEQNIIMEDVRKYVKKNANDIIAETLNRRGIDRRCTRAMNSLMEGINNSASENGGYTHYAVSKTSGKIVNGWDYEGYEPSELRQFKKDYFIDDLKDMGFNPKNVKILTLKGLQREGIDPNDDNNWSNGDEDMQEAAIMNKIRPIVNEELRRRLKR